MAPMGDHEGVEDIGVVKRGGTFETASITQINDELVHTSRVSWSSVWICS